MFDESLPYKQIQVRLNKLEIESFSEEYIFKFYRHNQKCCTKYLVSIKKYEGAFFIIPNNQLIFKNLIIEKYEKIFSETN